MRHAAVLAALLWSAPALAAEADPWFGRDKALHFGVSALLARSGTDSAAWLPVLERPWQRAAVGGGLALSVGVAKELWDLSGRGDPSLKDLTWDVLGVATGVAVALVVDQWLLD